jgi:uncharacterized membrane protein YkvA (DUF1232 family)
MSARKSLPELLKGPLAQFIKQALVSLKDPKKLSRLLTSVLAYAKKNKSAVRAFLKDVILLWEMVNAWFKGEYRTIPKKTLILIIVALIYFVTPLDLIPDWLPGGFIDDAALLTWIMKSIASDIHKFNIWKRDIKHRRDVFESLSKKETYV